MVKDKWEEKEPFFIIKIKAMLQHTKPASRQFCLSCAHRLLGVAWHSDSSSAERVLETSICSFIHPISSLHINFPNHVHSYIPFAVATAFTHSNLCHVCINPAVMVSLLLKMMLAGVLPKCPEPNCLRFGLPECYSGKQPDLYSQLLSWCKVKVKPSIHAKQSYLS